VPLSTQLFGDLQRSELLSQHPDAFPQKVGLLNASLAQHIPECDSQFVGHRRGSFSSLISTSAMRTTRWPFASTA
jgi:hypothetical protein